MLSLTPNQWTILEMLERGPRWARSFQYVKPLLADLIAKGLVERCKPDGGRANNMARLTDAGADLLRQAA
jgi:DNA-binding PadR family transcriptional regulator